MVGRNLLTASNEYRHTRHVVNLDLEQVAIDCHLQAVERAVGIFTLLGSQMPSILYNFRNINT